MEMKHTIQLEVTDELRKVFRSLMDIDYSRQVLDGNITYSERSSIIEFVNTVHSLLEH